MQALAAFLCLCVVAAGLFVSGVYVIGGLGFALFAAGICAALGAIGLRRGMIDGE